MAKLVINLGSEGSGGANGDTLREAFTKAIANFDELYAGPLTWAIGVDVQAHSTTLDLIAAGTWQGGTNLVTLGTITTGTWHGSIIAPAYLGTGSSITTKFLRGDGTWQTVDTSTLQPLDSDLTAIAALTTTSFGRSFLTLADAAAGQTLLSLGTLATQNGTFSGTSSGTNTGDQSLSALMTKAANLSDVADAYAAQANLGLGSLATQTGTFSGTHSGTSSGTNTGDQLLPIGLDANITFSNDRLWNLDGHYLSLGDFTFDSTGLDIGGLALSSVGTGGINFSGTGAADTRAHLGLATASTPTFAGVTATTFTGDLTGNAASATKLVTARAINGTNFDGTAPITITAAAGTLTGSTLAAGVTASSLTSVGTLTNLFTSGAIYLSGTAGASFICLPYQSIAPSAPGASKAILYPNATGQPFWMQPDGVATGIQTNSRRRAIDLYTECLSQISSDSFVSVNAGTGSTGTTMATAVAGHPGIRALATGTTTTGSGGNFSSNAFNAMVLGGGAAVFETCVAVPTLSDGTDTFTVRLGLQQSGTGESTDGVYFRYLHSNVSGHWQGVCRASSVESTADLTDAVTVGQYDTLRFEVNAAASSITFYVNGVSRGTITTNIPTSVAGSIGCNIIKSAGTTSRTLNVDFISWHQDLTTLR